MTSRVEPLSYSVSSPRVIVAGCRTKCFGPSFIVVAIMVRCQVLSTILSYSYRCVAFEAGLSAHYPQSSDIICSFRLTNLNAPREPYFESRNNLFKVDIN